MFTLSKQYKSFKKPKEDDNTFVNNLNSRQSYIKHNNSTNSLIVIVNYLSFSSTNQIDMTCQNNFKCKGVD